MVSWAKTLENTGTPSGGHPTPVKGLQSGEEYLRRPTSVMGVGFGPVITDWTVRHVQRHARGNLAGGNVERAIGKELPAGQVCVSRCIGNSVEVQAGLRIAGVQL